MAVRRRVIAGKLELSRSCSLEQTRAGGIEDETDDLTKAKLMK